MGKLLVSNVSKAYKRYPGKWARASEWITGRVAHENTWVLRDISFQVEAGEAVGIVGVNGAGKSTLLKIITGTTRPTTGTVSTEGRVAALLELGMGFHPDFTGRQNALMAGQLLGLSAKEVAERMPEIEAFAAIGDYMDQPLRTYSSGMQMRVAFSVATAVRPDVLIIDEALSVGDVFFQQKCFERIKSFQGAGTTLLFVSHSPAAVAALCNRGLLLHDGRIRMDGTPKEVIDLYNAISISAASPGNSALRIIESVEVRASDIVPASDGVPALAPESGSARAAPVSVGSYVSEGVEITRVALMQSGGEAAAVRSGDSVQLQVRVVFGEAYEDPHVGFQIRDANGQAVFMTTTAGLGRHSGAVASGDTLVAEFDFALPLAAGDYTVTAGVADEVTPDGRFVRSLARTQSAKAFSVYKEPTGRRWSGLVDLNPECKVQIVD